MDKRSFFSGAAIAALTTALLTTVAPAVADFRRSDQVAVDRDGMINELTRLAHDASEIETFAARLGKRGLARRAEQLEGRLSTLAGAIAQAPAIDERRPGGGRPNRRQPMNDESFAALTGALASAPYASDDLALIDRVARESWFTSAQVITLMDQFVYSSDKIECAARLYARVTDTQNAWQIYEKLPFSSDRDTLRQRLGQ